MSTAKRPTREHWRPNESATTCAHPACDRTFSLFNRRHHCRKCGDIFCSDHCEKELQLDANAEPSTQTGWFCRVCDACHAIGYSEVNMLSGWDHPASAPAPAPAPASAHAPPPAAAPASAPVEVPHFGLEPAHDMPATLVLPEDATGTVFEVQVLLQELMDAFDVLNLVAELVVGLPSFEAKYEVVVEHRAALDGMIPLFARAQDTCNAVLDSSVLRSTPELYNYFVLAAKEIQQASLYVANIDHALMVAPVTESAPASTLQAVEATGPGPVHGSGSGSGSDSDSDSDDAEGSLVVRGGGGGEPAAAAVAVALPAAGASAAGTGSDAAASAAQVVARFEAEAEEAVSSLLTADGPGREQIGHNLRFLRKRLRVEMDRLAAVPGSVLGADDAARFMSRLRAVADYVDGYAASVLNADAFDVASRIAELESEFFELLSMVDGSTPDDDAAAAAIIADVKAFSKTLAKERCSLRSMADDAGSSVTLEEATRGINRIEDIQENMADLIHTCDKKFGSRVNFGRAPAADAAPSQLVQARAAHSRVESDMFGL